MCFILSDCEYDTNNGSCTEACNDTDGCVKIDNSSGLSQSAVAVIIIVITTVVAVTLIAILVLVTSGIMYYSKRKSQVIRVSPMKK